MPEWMRAPAWAWALVACATLIGMYLAVEYASGRIPALLAGVPPVEAGCPWLIGDYRLSIVGIILLCYVACARTYLDHWTNENADELSRRIVATSVPSPYLVRGHGWVLAGAGGVVLSVLVGLELSERPIEMSSEYWIFPHTFNWLWCIPFGWVGGRFLFAVVASGHTMRRLASRIEVVNLFDAELARPFLRQALRTALLVLVFVGLVSVHFVDTGSGWIAIAVVVGLMVVASTVALMPMLGFHRLVGGEKQRALQQVRKAMSRHGDRLYGHAASPEVPNEPLADLVAMEKRLADVAEWPVTLSGASWLVVYMFIGLGSWLGAAMVERLLDQWLG